MRRALFGASGWGANPGRPLPVLPVLHEKEHTYMVKIVLLMSLLLVRLVRARRFKLSH